MDRETKISSQTVRADFNDPITVVHYARAAHFLGLWKSERILIERYFPDREVRLIEAGCGAGRVTLGLWEMGFHHVSAFDFAEELLEQARSLAVDRGATGIQFFHADATCLSKASDLMRSDQAADSLSVPPKALLTSSSEKHPRFDGALFMFNGLMQIPGRANRRKALCELARICREGAPILFTTHDRDASPRERALWREEATRWARGEQDSKLVEYGDRYFTDEAGRTFMHLPNRTEILEDLAATGWVHDYDALRREITKESRAVLDFSDECRFWVARRAVAG